ncbi:alkaline phosphatase [bacterium]|nr:alkaline phosphatase [bacterium]
MFKKLLVAVLLLMTTVGAESLFPEAGDAEAEPSYVILLIADGWGYKHLEAAEGYSGQAADYQSWQHLAMATWDLDTQLYHDGVGYDPERFWSEFDYATAAYTDSASSATAFYTGMKTDSGNISVGPGDVTRLKTIGEYAAEAGLASGVVTSVYLSHATPAAWYAHNDARQNGYAIFDEGVWGEAGVGSHGSTVALPIVMIGAGHPVWNDDYINSDQLLRLRGDCFVNPRWSLVERIEGDGSAGERLIAAAADSDTERLFGLFGGEYGCFDWQLADGSENNPANPTLAECATAAITVLERDPDGFALMIEGGATDWASHSNYLDGMLGELFAFNDAVETVCDWVENPANGSSWENTLVLVTGDHECGYLTAGVGVLPDKPLGEVSPRTLALETEYDEEGHRAAWEDGNGNGSIDSDEEVYWAWNSGSHSNSLIPLYARGHGAELLTGYAIGEDPVRGGYLDNTALFNVMLTAFSW